MQASSPEDKIVISLVEQFYNSFVNRIAAENAEMAARLPAFSDLTPEQNSRWFRALGFTLLGNTEMADAVIATVPRDLLT